MRFQDFAGKSWGNILPGADGDAIDLVSKLVNYESIARLTAAEVLRHPFVSQEG